MNTKPLPPTPEPNADGQRQAGTPVAPTRGDYIDLWAHHKPAVLVRITKDYIVHVDERCKIDWETTPQYDSDVPRRSGYDKAKETAILLEVANLEAIPCEGIELAPRQEFKLLVGEAIVCAFEQDYAAAKKTLTAASQYIRARSEETSRAWYLWASFWATVPFIVLGLVVWAARAYFLPALGATALWLAMASSAGAVGALFSVIARSGRLKFDCSAGKKLHYLEGASRILAGAISGILVALAVRSQMIFGPLIQGGREHLVMILAALAAGAGERLATSIISKFDSTHPATSATETSKPTVK